MRIIYDERSDKPWRVLDKHGRQFYLRDETATTIYKPMIPVYGKTEAEVIEMLLKHISNTQAAMQVIEGLALDAINDRQDAATNTALREIAVEARKAWDGFASTWKNERLGNE